MARNSCRNYTRKVVHHLVRDHNWDEQEAYNLCQENKEYIQGQWAFGTWQTKVARYLTKQHEGEK